MKIALHWLNEYLDRPTDAAEAQTLLTDIGLPVEQIEQVAGDTMLDVEVSSNRPDCLSHIGVARELAAATNQSLKLPTVEIDESKIPVESLTSVENLDSRLCPLYTARVITGVKVTPSPDWLVKKLHTIGLRPVNNIVDITNFVLHETGQPLHAFDLNKLAEKRIVVRRATNGEKFTALDGSKHVLNSNMLVIADASDAQAVAGVMGGGDSEVTDSTTDILLESARFDPLNVRTTSRALKLTSDSSYRFERGVDPLGVDLGSQRASQLILELAGGTLAGGVIHAGDTSAPPITVSMRPDRCRELLGYPIDDARMMEIFNALGLNPRNEDDVICCTIPTHRLDLKREADLIEEVARHFGFEHIPIEPRMHIVAQRLQPNIQARREISRILVAHGYHETISFSFLAPKSARPFLPPGATFVTVDEEKKNAEPALRPSLLPSLLSVRKANQDAGNQFVSLFEIADAYHLHGDQYIESRRLGMISDVNQDIPNAMRRVRGALDELFESLGLGHDTQILPAEKTAWSDSPAQITSHDKTLGSYGPANASILSQFDLQQNVILAELDFDSLITAYPPMNRAAPPPRFPAIDRDLSLILDESKRYCEIETIIDDLKPDLLEEIHFVTAYRGKPIPSGKKSITLRFTFRDPNRTLRHEEVSGQMDSLIAALTDQLDAEVRTD